MRLTLLLAAAFLGFSACDELKITPAAQGQADLETLVTSPRSSTADSESKIIVRASLATTSRLQPRRITFTTTAGAFEGGGGSSITVSAGADGVAEVSLRAPSQANTAVVRATAGNTTLRDSIVFTRAYAERVDVEPSKFAIRGVAGEELIITAYLRRDIGMVEPGTWVDFTAVRADSQSLGRFGVPTSSDSAGIVKVRYTPGATEYTGPVTIIASAPAIDGGKVEGRTVIDILPQSSDSSSVRQH